MSPFLCHISALLKIICGYGDKNEAELSMQVFKNVLAPPNVGFPVFLSLLSVHGKGYAYVRGLCFSVVPVLWSVHESQLVNLFPEQQQLSHNQGMFALTAPCVQ